MLSHLPRSTHPITSETGEKVYSEGQFLSPPPTQITPPSFPVPPLSCLWTASRVR